MQIRKLLNHTLIFQNGYQVMQISESEGRIVSQLMRISNKLGTVLETAPWLQNNKTFDEGIFAMGAVNIGTELSEKNPVITFGTTGTSWRNAKTSFGITGKISKVCLCALIRLWTGELALS